MTMMHRTTRSTAVAALFSLPFVAGSALAQSAETGQATDAATPTPDAAQSQAAAQPQDQASQQEGAASTDAAGNPQADAVVARVGDTEIRGADVMAAIGLLPPQMQAQPPQMLVPIALEQLILRELLLQEARGQNLASDPEVTALVERTVQDAEENAMLQVWLDREMAKAVTDEAVQQLYDEAKAEGGADFPPMEELRPQIEQHLRQQKMQDLRTQVREGADVVLYDPAGRPIEDPSGAAQTGGATGGDAATSQSGNGETQGSASGGSSDSASNGQPTGN